MGSNFPAQRIRANVKFTLLLVEIFLFALVVQEFIKSYFWLVLDIYGFRCSYAEMPKEEKNKISHRYKALALVKSHFAEAAYAFQTDASIWDVLLFVYFIDCQVFAMRFHFFKIRSELQENNLLDFSLFRLLSYIGNEN